MSSADSYRQVAASLHAKALAAATKSAVVELETLALCYLRLAAEADRNTRSDVSAEFAPRSRDGEAT
jgi:hypothetical protein